MKQELEQTVQLPDGVTTTLDARTLTVKGEKGELVRDFIFPGLMVTVDGNTVKITSNVTGLMGKKRLFTARAHIKNMIEGVTEGFTYKLKICSGHFPMAVAVKGNKFEVKNFIGEKVPRVVTIKEGADVKVDGDIVTITGMDKEIVGQTAADIEKITRRPGFDNRIFQDGIFIVEKNGKKV